MASSAGTSSSNAPQETPPPPASSSGAKPTALPRCSAWFSLDKINPLEKRMLPEFFMHEDQLASSPTPSKTPTIYMKYRNYMVQAYRQQPDVYLTATACRRSLAGDACAILRVHEFLTHWGIINFSVPSHKLPRSYNANYNIQPASAPDSTDQTSPIAVLAEASKTDDENDESQTKCQVCGVHDVAFTLSAEAKRRTAGMAASIAGKTNGSHENTSGSNEMAIDVFCAKPGSGVCVDCFLSRSFPEGISASDFERRKHQPEWTEAETTALLEAVNVGAKNTEKGCDWNEIAAKVETKTPEECVMHFLELPISTPTHLPTRTTEAPTVTDRPYEYADGMNGSVVDLAKLLEDVDPFVAKAAAKAAVQAIQQLHTSTTSDNGNADVNDVLKQTVESVEKSKEEIGYDPSGVHDIKVEGSTSNGQDVEMEEKDEKTNVSKDTIQVAKQAADATAVGLLAGRADNIRRTEVETHGRDMMLELVQNQVRQMELKMKKLEALEKVVQAEREDLKKERYEFYLEKLKWSRDHVGAKR